MRMSLVLSFSKMLWSSFFKHKDSLMLIFFLSASLVFFTQVSLFEGMHNQIKLLSGVFWITLLFVSLIVQHHLQSELKESSFEQGLYHKGMKPFELYMGKSLFHLGVMCVSSLTIGFLLILFVSPVLPKMALGNTVVFFILSCVAIVSLETLVFSMFSQIQASLLLTSIILYPLLAPLFIFIHVSGVKLLNGSTEQVMLPLLGINMILFALGGLLFDWVVEELL